MVRAALQRPLLGRAAQLEMAVRPRPGDRPDLPNPCPREAAVLMLLYPRQGELVLPLTQRTDTVEMHRGQVSLPGGAREPQDRDFAQTALRETCEELGIPEGAVQLLGALSPLTSHPANSASTPTWVMSALPHCCTPIRQKWPRSSRCRCETCWNLILDRLRYTGETGRGLRCPSIGSLSRESGGPQP
jgi:8-oxo-dGTP pyrophosphatase MutT (NUDIX family)